MLTALAQFFGLCFLIGLLVGFVRSFLTRNAKIALASDNLYVIDGDTIDLDGTRIRLFGIDAPEIGQDGGKLARAQLSTLLDGKSLEGQYKAIDHYGRTVAVLFADGINVNAEMVKTGYALGDHYSGTLVREEKRARRQKLGLWESVGIASPKDYRNA